MGRPDKMRLHCTPKILKEDYNYVLLHLFSNYTTKLCQVLSFGVCHHVEKWLGSGYIWEVFGPSNWKNVRI